MGKARVHDMWIYSDRDRPSGTPLAAMLVAGACKGKEHFCDLGRSVRVACISHSGTHNRRQHDPGSPRFYNGFASTDEAAALVTFHCARR